MCIPAVGLDYEMLLMDLPFTAEEIERLKEEAAAFRQVRADLGEEDGPRRVFEKVSSKYRQTHKELTESRSFTRTSASSLPWRICGKSLVESSQSHWSMRASQREPSCRRQYEEPLPSQMEQPDLALRRMARVARAQRTVVRSS